MEWDAKKIEEAELYSACQLTQGEMALLWGVNENTITRWKDAHPEFAEALERGKARIMAGAARVLIADALQNKNTASAKYILENLSKGRWGQKQQVDVTVRRGMDLERVEDEFWGRQIQDATGVAEIGDTAETPQLPAGVPEGQEQVPAVGEEPEDRRELDAGA